jgi:type VI secretion system protein ImpA
VHPRPNGDDLTARWSAISSLDLPTVIFPLQYMPLFDARRIGTLTYRAWLIASGEIKPRAGESAPAAAAMTEAVHIADPAALIELREHLKLLDTSIERIRHAFAERGSSVKLDGLSALVRKIRLFVDPGGAAEPIVRSVQSAGDDADNNNRVSDDFGELPPMSVVAAKRALAAVADYYDRAEPSSPTLPLVRQAHQLIGKSFLEVMTILMPSQVEKAAFQIGANQGFDLPLGKLPAPSSEFSNAGHSTAAEVDASVSASSDATGTFDRVESRRHALALLDAVQRYFRHTEPSSPVPMLCERARALAERDFMSVLEDVLPKSALKAFNTDK